MQIWSYHDEKMKELKKIYNKINKQTQLRLQEIFDSIDFDFDNLYSIADSKTKRRINNYIEKWKDENLLEGYFGILANNIYEKTNVKNSEILELLIYSAYIEEQSKIEKSEKKIMYEDINYYYQQGQEEVNKTLKKKKPISVLEEALFLLLLAKPNAKGYIWNDYKMAMAKYNSEQIFRQITIDLQQQKELDIANDIYQNLIKRQNNSRLNINDDKISGDIDLTLIGINNQAKLEGIYSFDENAEVEFIAIEDNVTTKMCHSLNGQRFKVHDWNTFKRYSKSNDSILKYRCYGLIIGLNLPPINDGFHWCRSTVRYVNEDIIEQDKKYNIFNNNYDKKLRGLGIDNIQIKNTAPKVLSNILEKIESVYNDFPQIKGKIKSIKEINGTNEGLNIQPQKDGTYVMEINKNKFYKEKVAKDSYEKDVKNHYHPKNGTYKDIGIHEAGHMVLNEILRKKYNDFDMVAIDWNNNITSKQIVDKAFDKLKISDIMQQKRKIADISIYAERYNSSETIAEAFVDYYVNKNNAQILSKAIIEVMKGMI